MTLNQKASRHCSKSWMCQMKNLAASVQSHILGSPKTSRVTPKGEDAWRDGHRCGRGRVLLMTLGYNVTCLCFWGSDLFCFPRGVAGNLTLHLLGWLASLRASVGPEARAVGWALAPVPHHLSGRFSAASFGVQPWNLPLVLCTLF